MRPGVMIALVLLFSCTASFAAEQETITVPFPKVTVDYHADNFFCKATLGTVLEGTSRTSKLVSLGVEKAEISAKAYHASDRIVVEISGGKLYMFNRDEFDRGKTTRDFPFEIIENSETNLVAIATGIIEPRGANIFTLNRKTGIASWTIVMSVGLPSDSPRIDAIYLSCGGPKD